MPVSGSLSFDVSKGRYQKALENKGYTLQASCASDCNWLNGVKAPDTYCSSGVAADAVLSVTRPPVINGVAGSGGSCVVDQDHRPLWLVFAWYNAGDLTANANDNVVEFRGLITHEIMHALGFSNWAFSRARDSSGALKRLLSLETVTDNDGSTDKVYFFTKGRAYELAQDYFNCHDETQWQGLPLMGLPDIGRASHWETRVMRDDVMSYGQTGRVSAITLAAMEDTGWYLANYSSAQCMLWGLSQGCNYVQTRCGTGIDDRSASATSLSDCEGEPGWPADSDDYLSQKCDGGINPCSDAIASGYQALNQRCNAQCNIVQAQSNCSKGPAGPVDSASDNGIKSSLTDDWTQWLFLLTWLLGALFLIGPVRKVICPPEGSKTFANSLSVVVMILGGALLGFSIWAKFYTDAFDAFVGFWGLWACFGIGIGLLTIALTTMLGICIKSRCLLTSVSFVLIFLILCQIAFAILIFYWAYSLFDVSQEQDDTLNGNSEGKWDGRFGEEALEQVESFVCNTYTLCCRDPALDSVALTNTSTATGATCLNLHGGVTTDVSLTLQDPSQPEFCPYVSGSSNTLRPSDGTCDALNWLVPGITLDDCRAEFCPTGVEGYSAFVDDLIGWMRNNAKFLGTGFALFTLVQVWWVINVWNLRKRGKESQVYPDGAGSSNTKKKKGYEGRSAV